jgi:hypothetical protein
MGSGSESEREREREGEWKREGKSGRGKTSLVACPADM